MSRFAFSFVSLVVAGSLFAVAPPPTRSSRWIADLGDDAFQVRQDAERDLRALRPEPVFAILRAALFHEDLETRHRATRIFRYYHDRGQRQAQALAVDPGLAAALFARAADRQVEPLRRPNAANRLLRRWQAALNGQGILRQTKAFRDARKAYANANTAAPFDPARIRRTKDEARDAYTLLLKAYKRGLAEVELDVTADESENDAADPMNLTTVRVQMVQYPRGAGAQKFALRWNIETDELQVTEYLFDRLIFEVPGLLPADFHFTGGIAPQRILFTSGKRNVSVSPRARGVVTTFTLHVYGPRGFVGNFEIGKPSDWTELFLTYVPKRKLANMNAARLSAAAWAVRLGAPLAR